MFTANIALSHGNYSLLLFTLAFKLLYPPRDVADLALGAAGQILIFISAVRADPIFIGVGFLALRGYAGVTGGHGVRGFLFFGLTIDQPTDVLVDPAGMV